MKPTTPPINSINRKSLLTSCLRCEYNRVFTHRELPFSLRLKAAHLLKEKWESNQLKPKASITPPQEHHAPFQTQPQFNNHCHQNHAIRISSQTPPKKNHGIEKPQNPLKLKNNDQ